MADSSNARLFAAICFFLLYSETAMKTEGALGAETARGSANLLTLVEGRQRLRSLADEGDLSRFRKAATEIHLRWARREIATTLYAQLMLVVVQQLDSGKFSDRDQYTLAEHYRLMLLESAEELPLEVEVDLLHHELGREYKSEDRSLWPGQRRRQAERLLHGWRRLRDASDTDFDPTVRDFVGPNNVPLPDGVTKGASGMSPKNIEDPVLRSKYEKAIAENARRAEEYLRRSTFRNCGERFFPSAEAALVERYSRPRRDRGIGFSPP